MTARISEFAELIDRYQVVLLDTDVVLARMSGDEALGPLTEVIFTRMEQDLLLGCVGRASVIDFLTKPESGGFPGNPDAVLDSFILHPSMLALPADLPVNLRAASVRETYGLEPADALIVGTALVFDCDAFVTADERWKKVLEPLNDRLACICLRDFA